MAIVTAGYDGALDEVQFAEAIHRYSVVGADDFKATTQAGDRIVAIADGVALGPGTRDVATAIPNIQFAAATGTRWDLVVLRRDWQPPGGASSIVIIQGGSTKGYPTVGTAATNWNRRPGIMDDQPLYLQEINGAFLGTRIDLRCWAGHGGLSAVSEDVKTYLDRVGTEVQIGTDRWTYGPGTNGVPAWDKEFAVYAPLAVNAFTTSGTVTVQKIGNRKQVNVNVRVTRSSATSLAVNDSFINLGVILPPEARGGSTGNEIYMSLGMVGGGMNEIAQGTVHPVTGQFYVSATLWGAHFQWRQYGLATFNCQYLL